VHPLVAEAEADGELAQRRAVQMQPPNGLVELSPGHLDVALGVDQPFPGSLGLGEQLAIHMSTVTRRLTPANGPTAWVRADGQRAWPVSKRLTLPFVIVKAHRVRISPQVSLR
jgi:hypothetical protein